MSLLANREYLIRHVPHNLGMSYECLIHFQVNNLLDINLSISLSQLC